jgi:hypothetical protein
MGPCLCSLWTLCEIASVISASSLLSLCFLVRVVIYHSQPESGAYCAGRFSASRATLSMLRRPSFPS